MVVHDYGDENGVDQLGEDRLVGETDLVGVVGVELLEDSHILDHLYIDHSLLMMIRLITEITKEIKKEK
jgi:hypothetical protein